MEPGVLVHHDLAKQYIGIALPLDDPCSPSVFPKKIALKLWFSSLYWKVVFWLTNSRNYNVNWITWYLKGAFVQYSCRSLKKYLLFCMKCCFMYHGWFSVCEYYCYWKLFMLGFTVLLQWNQFLILILYNKIVENS